MITKKFGIDFGNPNKTALTLPADAVTDNEDSWGIQQRTHESGWTIRGEVKDEFYRWVNAFEATHPRFGYVGGDFEREVYAKSEEAFADFMRHHEPNAWDYEEI